MQFPVGKVGFSVGNCIFMWESYYNYKSSVLQNQDKHYEIKKQQTFFSYTLSQLCKSNIPIQPLSKQKLPPFKQKEKRGSQILSSITDCLALIVLL